MPKQQFVDALEELRSERADAAAVVGHLQRKLAEAQDNLARFDGAVVALEALVNPGVEKVAPDVDAASQDTGTSARSIKIESLVAETRRHDVPPRLAKYVPVGGKRLRSKMMVFDLLQAIGRPISREDLHHSFFEYYGREDIEKYWMRPDNALNTAIDRAVAEHIIWELPPANGKPVLYTSGLADTETGKSPFLNEEDD